MTLIVVMYAWFKGLLEQGLSLVDSWLQNFGQRNLMKCFP